MDELARCILFVQVVGAGLSGVLWSHILAANLHYNGVK